VSEKRTNGVVERQGRGRGHLATTGDGAAAIHQKAWIVHPHFQGPALKGEPSAERDPEARLAEAAGLARAIELEVAGTTIAPLRQPRPATLIGSGKVEELKEIFEAQPVDLVVVDADLSPVQQRNLERAWNAKVIDRTGLILEIFGERAQTREGVLQVELAALSYQRSRLVRSWTHLERQRGGLGFVGGPGESQLELDRRRIDERMAMLRRELDEVKRTRGLHRKARRRVPYPVVSLVGYTNAGKSTLFNRMTGAHVGVEDKLFATLDPTMRVVRLPSGRRVILSDTVGFITDLPTTLIAAFRATLEEVLEADLLLHVRDITHVESEAQAGDVVAVLDELGVDPAWREAHLIEVWNKTDRLDNEARARVGEEARRHGAAVPVSAVAGHGIDTLLERIDERLAMADETLDLELGFDEGAVLNWLHQQGRVLERADDETGFHVKVALPKEARARLEERLGRGVGVS